MTILRFSAAALYLAALLLAVLGRLIQKGSALSYLGGLCWAGGTVAALAAGAALGQLLPVTLLLAASLVFYAGWNRPMTLLLLAVIAVTYLAGRGLARASPPAAGGCSWPGPWGCAWGFSPTSNTSASWRRAPWGLRASWAGTPDGGCGTSCCRWAAPSTPSRPCPM